MLRCLHGLGDTVQFIRYAPWVRREAQSLVVEAHPEITRLLRRVQGIDEVITWGAAAPAIQPEWDAQIEVTELPRIFGTTVETIPADVPYLSVPRSSTRAPSARKKVGVVWSSSQWNPARSVPAQLLASALRDLPWEVVSLQHGPERERFPVLHRNEGDVLDTANDMLGLDLVISVDTMTAHLAGALAVPVWVLLPFEADWRWMLHRSDSPWYPTMRLFRQGSPGDWPGVLEEVRRAALTF